MLDNEQKAAKHFKTIREYLKSIKVICDFVEMRDSFTHADLAAMEKCLSSLDTAQNNLDLLWPEVYH
jgi:hypothetical protein